MAAAGSARRTLASCCSSLSPRILSNGCFKSISSSPSPSLARLSRRTRPRAIARIPVELGCAQSLMPLHSVTASVLLNSMLSSGSGNWAWLSEGFATPL